MNLGQETARVQTVQKTRSLGLGQYLSLDLGAMVRRERPPAEREYRPESGPGSWTGDYLPEEWDGDWRTRNEGPAEEPPPEGIVVSLTKAEDGQITFENHLEAVLRAEGLVLSFRARKAWEHWARTLALVAIRCRGMLQKGTASLAEPVLRMTRAEFAQKAAPHIGIQAKTLLELISRKRAAPLAFYGFSDPFSADYRTLEQLFLPVDQVPHFSVSEAIWEQPLRYPFPQDTWSYRIGSDPASFSWGRNQPSWSAHYQSALARPQVSRDQVILDELQRDLGLTVDELLVRVNRAPGGLEATHQDIVASLVSLGIPTDTTRRLERPRESWFAYASNPEDVVFENPRLPEALGERLLLALAELGIPHRPSLRTLLSEQGRAYWKHRRWRSRRRSFLTRPLPARVLRLLELEDPHSPLSLADLSRGAEDALLDAYRTWRKR